MAFTIEVLAFATSGPKMYWISSVIISFVIVIATARFGLLTTMVAQLVFFLSLAYPLTSDFSTWYLHAALFPIVIILALAIFGFYVSLGGQPLFKGSLLRK